MKLKLSHRFNLYIGGIIILGILVHLYHDFRSDEKFFKGIGIAEAERMCTAIFDQLYTSMRLGGGRDENRAIIERFKKIDEVKEIRVLHGRAMDRQYGIEEDEIPRDDLERAALEGTQAVTFDKSPEGYTTLTYIKPILIQNDCRKCHYGAPGEVSGAISLKLSFEKYQELIASHTRDIFVWGVGTFAFISIAILYTVRKRLLEPIEKLKEGALALASGDLTYRVDIKTSDELEDLGRAFDHMAESLHQATATLKDLSEKHSMLVDMAADAIILKDLATKKFTDANPAAVNLTGYSKEELLEMRSEDLYPHEKAQQYREVFKRWCHDGKGYLHDAVIIKKDGFTIPVEIAASVIDLRGRKYMQEIWRDLSERKGFEETVKKHIVELESTVKERTAKLNQSVEQLEIAYRRLQNSEQVFVESAKLISLGEMGAGIAHELNSPLAGILSITEVLLKRIPESDPNHFLLAKVKDAAVRSKYIILDMMTYARPSKGGFAPLFINETIKATLLLFTSELKTLSIEIIDSFDPALPKVFGNKGQLMEVFLNILKNARDAMGGAGKIYISTRTVTEKGAGFAVAEIRDTGPGIPKNVMPNIFDPFFTTKEKGGGMNIGLGLSISQSIVKEHGGRLDAENSPEGGAVFRVIIPLYEENDERA